MKKFFKIFGITLASLLGVVIIAIGIAVWFVFTPEKLTPIVRNLADKYITCEHKIGNVELTFFSTFPQFGLKVNNLYLVNPMNGAQSDTLLAASSVIAKANLRSLWKDNAIVLDAFELSDAQINVFVNTAGMANYNVFVTDTLPKEEDTTAFSIPFDAIRLSQVRMEAYQLSYIDKSLAVEADIQNFTADLHLDMIGNQGNGKIKLNAPNVSVKMDSTYYLQNGTLLVDAPLYADLDKMHFRLDEAEIKLNQFTIGVDGSVELPDNGDINTNIGLTIAQWQLKPLLELVPETFASMLKDIDIDIDGTLSLNGRAVGTYNETTMPLIDATVILTDANLKYSGLPYKLYDVQGNVDAHIDLNDSLASYARINSLQAKTGKSSVAASGSIEQLMADMDCDVDLKLHLNLPEVQPMMPSDMDITLSGLADGSAKAKFKMSQLENMSLDKMNISGQITFSDLDVYYDSMFVVSDKANLKFKIPNTSSTHKSTKFLLADLVFNNLNFKQGTSLTADISQAKLKAETSNVLADERYLSVACNFNIGQLTAAMDSISGELLKPNGTAFVRLDMKDSTALPTLSVDMAMTQLKGSMDTIDVAITDPKIKATIEGSLQDKTQPHLQANYSCSSLKADMGKFLHAQTDYLALEANAKQDVSKENILLQWDPKVNVNLQQGQIAIASFPETIFIPEIIFDFTTKDFVINDSQIKLGNSDFSLKGEIQNIGPWLDNSGLLTGELDFVSNVTDVNELIVLTSGIGGDDDETIVETSESAQPVTNAQEPKPYMVPKGVDLVLHTNIKKALVGEQIATKLGGDLYVRDGVLVLEEMGFVCEAAKLQLTAMYKTPRKNHLYVGLDYHMLDINIEELVKMIPQIDSIMPMLRSFKGKAEFHIAAETYTDGYYNLKPSTIRGACSIAGKDLVLLDGETFSEIAKILLFNKKTENKVDSISAEFTVFKQEVDIYPFLVTMDKYQAAVGGRHNLDMTFDYHISLLRPLRIGVDVKGNFDDMKIRLAACKYAADFRPVYRQTVETQNMELRKKIRESIQRNVRIE